MELTKEQLLHIDNYIFSCGIKYYDVRAEIVDHFANILEQKLDETPNLNFKREIINIHKNFSDRGFYKLLEQKTKSVKKQFYKKSFHLFISFFKLPKIIITIFLFFILSQLMALFENKEIFFNILVGIGFVLVTSIFIRIYLNKKNKKEIFLSLDMNNTFLQFFNFAVICLNSVNQLRSSDSFLNDTYNHIHLGVFTLLLLFYWSSEYVFYQNKKLVKQQYPNVLI